MMIWFRKRKKAGKKVSIWIRLLVILVGFGGLSIFTYMISPSPVSETPESEVATSEVVTSEVVTYYVKSKAANVRECPQIPCKVIDTLSQNTELIFPGDLFDKYPDWAEVTFQDGRVGYVSKTTLSENKVSAYKISAETPPQGSGIALGEGNFDPLVVGYSYDISFCVPDSARSGATCGGLAGETQTPVGGSPPYSLVKGSGFLPLGMSLELNGLLSGTPTTEGTYNFQICAKDLQMNQGCQSYKMVVVKEEETSPIAPGPSSPSEPEPTVSLPTDEEFKELTLTIDSFSCKPTGNSYTQLDQYYRDIEVFASGSAKGSVRTFFDANADKPEDMNCGSWYRNPYGICIRNAGEPETTSWTYRRKTWWTLSSGYIPELEIELHYEGSIDLNRNDPRRTVKSTGPPC